MNPLREYIREMLTEASTEEKTASINDMLNAEKEVAKLTNIFWGSGAQGLQLAEMVGATDKDGIPLSEIFDLEGQIWRPISIFPKDLHSFRIVNFGTNIFLCGGHDGKKITNKCWIYDDTLSNWAEISPMPFARAEHIMVQIDDKIYVLGGIGDEPEIVMSYDLISRNWQYNLSKFLMMI